jgi:hypothetical protein
LWVNITLVSEILGVKYIRAKGYTPLRELIIEEIQNFTCQNEAIKDI